MGSIGWLAIADLHAGPPGAPTLWTAAEEELRRDLERVHKHAGPFDFVLCAGDLVQSGARGEMSVLTDRLESVLRHLRTLGSSPAVLVVPGNHDLVPPDPRSPAARALLQWTHDPELRGSLFWHETNGQGYRDVVAASFQEFTAWARAWNEAHPLGAAWSRNDAGLLPGDFAASLRTESASLGIVGLNSAFLHLAPGKARGTIAIHPAQLQKLCGDPHEWSMAHDACILVTHHPPDWLTPDALPLYQGAIFRPEWFGAHFCGHAHEPQSVAVSAGSGRANRVYQVPSFLGLETWPDGHNNAVPRVHGYFAVRLDVDADRRGALTFWPRIVQPQKNAAGKYRVIPDHADFDLDDDGAFKVDLGVRVTTPPARSLRFGPPRAASPAAAPRNAATATPLPGGAPLGATPPGAAAPEEAAPRSTTARSLIAMGAQAMGGAGNAKSPAKQAETAQAPAGAARRAAPEGDAPTLVSGPSAAPSPTFAPTSLSGESRVSRTIVSGDEADQEEDEEGPPEPPGLGYNARWYVPNESKEQLILGTLRHPGAPVVVTAPPFSGKSTVLQRIVSRLRDEHRSGRERCLVLLIDLGSMGDATLNDPPSFFVELANQIVDAYERAVREAGKAPPADTDDWVENAWKRPGAPEARLTNLVERRILRDDHDRMVLAIDRADRFVGKPAGDPMARMLRQWVRAGALGDPLWVPFRLGLAAAGSSLYFYAPDAVSELFASATHVRIESFGLGDVRVMSKMYGGTWTDAELARLVEMVDGQPYLCRMILFLSCTGVPKAELLDVERLKIEHCATVLRQVWLRVADQPDLRKPLCLLLRDPTTKLTTDEYHRLYQAGLVRRVDGVYTVPNQLVANYFKEQC